MGRTLTDNFDEARSGWKDENNPTSPRSPIVMASLSRLEQVKPTNKTRQAQNVFENMRASRAKPEVFVHVESHEMHDVEAASSVKKPPLTDDSPTPWEE
jgi:hypothetical protein